MIGADLLFFEHIKKLEQKCLYLIDDICWVYQLLAIISVKFLI